MKRKVSEGITWLEFEIFAPFPEIQHAIILRHGGFSQGSFSSMNLSRSGGDDESQVIANFSKIKSLFNFPYLVQANQIHGRDVHHVTEHRRDLVGDGLITQERELPLIVTHADCQAALFYDPVKKAVAAVHSGWRGSVHNIYAQTIQKMESHFGTDAKDLHVGISPSLGPFHAEFIHYQTELPQAFWKYQIRPNHFDFWQISEMQLKEAGVPINQIEIARLCTYSNPEDFYSYRRCKLRGGHASLIALRTTKTQ